MKKKTNGKRKLVLKKTTIVDLTANVASNQNGANGTNHCTHPTTTVQHTFDC